MKIDIDEELSMMTSRAGAFFERVSASVDRAFSQMDKVIDEAFGGPVPVDSAPSGRRYRVLKRKQEVVVEVDLPGVAPSDVSVNVVDGVMVISWKRKTASDDASGEYKFGLSKTADVSSITAHAANGLLTVVVPGLREQPGATHQVKIHTD